MGLRRLLATTVAVLALPGAGTALAADFTPGPGDYTADTTALTITGPGTNITGTDENGVAVFSFDSVSIPLGVNITASGSRPLLIRATGAISLAGTLAGNGVTAVNFDDGPGGPGGPGGGAGGAFGLNPGQGPGGGGASSDFDDGGGGGGFGGAGAQGGLDGPRTPAAGGAAYGDLFATLQGGSGGAGSSTVQGGGGGGAIALVGSSVTVAATGILQADGGSGSGGDTGASGGGSGGGILLHAATIDISGTVSAKGGDGGGGGCCGDGGGGGGGRIAYEYGTSLSRAGTESLVGGTSGNGANGGCCPSGGASPDPKGADGEVALRQFGPAIASVSPGSGAPGTAVTITGANFTGATAVTFGDVAATFTVTDDSHIAATVPAGHFGAVDVRVTTPGGTTPISDAARFTVTIVPTDDEILAGLKTPVAGTIPGNRSSVSFTDKLPAGGRVHYSLDISFAAPAAPTAVPTARKPIHIGSLTIAQVTGASQTVKVPVGAKGRKLLKKYKKAKIVLVTFYARAADGKHFRGSRDVKVKGRPAFAG
jgi:hypothetical protein